MKNTFILILFTLILSGCSVNSINKTTYLMPGMTSSEVRSIMGNPDSSEFSNGYTIWKYSLQKAWVGFIPHYLAFNKKNELVSWKANLNEYYENQNLWIDALPKQHNINVNGNVNHDVNGTLTIQ